MTLYKYSVQAGAGTARTEGYSETLQSAKIYARKHSFLTSLIVFVSEHPGNEILAAYESGEEIPVTRAEQVARNGYGRKSEAEGEQES